MCLWICCCLTRRGLNANGIRLRGLKTFAAARSNVTESKFLSPWIKQHLFGRSHDHAENGQNYLEVGPSDTNFPEKIMKLPQLHGKSIEYHVNEISDRQARDYKSLLNGLAAASCPPIPRKWVYETGWTCYRDGSEPFHVEFPDEDALFFDAEVCVRESFGPVLATAVSSNAWYSWVSPALTQNCKQPGRVCIQDLIPMGNQGKKPRVIVGHFVCYDSARIKECYDLSTSGLKFFDTMAAHVSVSGITDVQRYFLLNSPRKPDWAQLACGNSLKHVHLLYCGSELDKSERDVFVQGTISDINDRFQELCTYCALDVKATQSVFSKLFPLYIERFPHGATLAAMLEMSSLFIPVSGEVKSIVKSANELSASEDEEVKHLLKQLASDALSLMNNQKYKDDPWMWDQDWSVKKKKIQNGANHPEWYRKLLSQVSGPPSDELDIPFRRNIAAKLMQLCWGSFPLHYEQVYGWGMLIPSIKSSKVQDRQVPVESIKRMNNSLSPRPRITSVPSLKDYIALQKGVTASNSKLTSQGQLGFNAERAETFGQFYIQNGLLFKKLPHYISMEKNVGGALSTHILMNSCLRSGNEKAKRILYLLRKNVFWKRSGKAFDTLPIVWLDEHLSKGAVVPSVSVCGDFIRHPQEHLFSSLCSEKSSSTGVDVSKAMIAPEGWHFLSANIPDVDLWMASLLADSKQGSYCSSPFGQMFSEGSLYTSLSDPLKLTVLQSALVFHAVLWGANRRYLTKLLKEINPVLGDASITEKTDKLLMQLCGSPSYNKVSKPGGTLCELLTLIREIAKGKKIETPILQSRLSRVLESDPQTYLSLVQYWLIRSSVADYLHVLIVCFRDLLPNARLCTIGSHDMLIKFLVPEEERYQAAKSLHLANLYARAFSAAKVGLYDVPKVAAELPYVTLCSIIREDMSDDSQKLTFEEALLCAEKEAIGENQFSEP